jgi:hypothetical protein
MKTNNSNQKIIHILRKMDEVLQRNGYNQYQERIHRISKALLSIERHTDCFVSRFSVENKNDENVPREIASFDSTSNLIKVDTKTGDRDNDKDDYSNLNLDNILSFIEDELCIKRLVEDSTLSSSSDESDDTREEKNSKGITKDNMQRKFFNIELKLKGFLKQQHTIDLLKINPLDSIINDSKLKTPISKLTPTSNTRCIIKNFFEDKECIELAKKRMSMRDSKTELLEKLSHHNICKSNYDRISIKESEIKQEKQRISDFGEDDNVYCGNLGSPTKASFNFAKRGSIFKEQNKRFSNAHVELDTNYLNLANDRLLDVNEIESEESDSEK